MGNGGGHCLGNFGFGVLFGFEEGGVVFFVGIGLDVPSSSFSAFSGGKSGNCQSFLKIKAETKKKNIRMGSRIDLKRKMIKRYAPWLKIYGLGCF